MRLSPRAFNAHLNHMGQRFLWRRSSACPCYNPHSGAGKPGCPICEGKGRFWSDPVEAVAGVASSRVQREWAQFGIYESGDLVLSIPENSPMYEMGQFDRALMLNSTDHFSITLTRGQNDRIYLPVETISRVFWIHPQNDTIVDGGIPTVANDGSLAWAAGAPPAGMQYTIEGTRYSEYYCYGPYPSDRNEHQGARLPKRVVLRKFDLFGR